MFVVVDWANNALFGGMSFPSFDDAWGYIYEQFPDEECYDDYFVCEV